MSFQAGIARFRSVLWIGCGLACLAQGAATAAAADQPARVLARIDTAAPRQLAPLPVHGHEQAGKQGPGFARKLDQKERRGDCCGKRDGQQQACRSPG